MKSGLEVFDFKEEDELAEHAAGKFLSKFKNPSLHSPLSLSCDFIECVSQESEVPRGEMNGLACVDVVATESDCNCDADVNNTPMEMIEEDIVTEDGTSGLESAPQLISLIHHRDAHSMIPDDESRSLLAEQGARESSLEEPLTMKNQLNYSLSDSPSSSVPDDEKSGDDESMNESSPSSHAPNIAEGNAICDNITSNHHFSSNSEMDDIDVAVDYVVYGDTYFTGCLVTFSRRGIRINGSTEYGDQGIFSFEKGIDDIIRIESHHLDRIGTVNVKLRFLSKEAGQADSSGVEELEFAAVESNWLEIWEGITSMNVKYFALWSAMPDVNVSTDGGAELLQRRPYFPNFDVSFEDVIYPKGDSDAVSISKRDVDLLQPETFINDTIIDFYIQYLKNEIPPEERRRFHFFNSFFFRKLADMDKDPNSALDGRAAFLRVQKWTRKVDIFGKDYIFIPVNFNLHWSLLVICHPGEVANLKDEDAEKSLKVPCILHMDSIRGTHAGLKTLVQSYLWEEWKSRQNEPSEEVSSKFLNLRFVPLELPQQENSFDCGLFLLHYLELFLVDAPVNFSPFRIHNFSKFLNVNWFPPSEASLKRTLIERLISELLESRSGKVASGECSNGRQSIIPENNENEKKVGVEFVQERCSTAFSCHGNLSTSETGQGIEITLLESSSMRNPQCVKNDQGLVLREFFDSGVAAGSLLAQSFDQPPSFYRPASQIENDVEADEQFVYYPSGENVFQQIAGLTTPTGSIPYSFRGFRADNTWNPGIPGQEDDNESSAGTSVYDSDDSDVGIIENFPIVKIAPQTENIDQEQSPSMGNKDSVTDALASASGELLETCVGEVTEGPDKMHDNDNKISGLASCQENLITSMQEDPIMVQHGINHDIQEAEVVGNDLQIIDNQVKSNVTGDEVQTFDENVNTNDAQKTDENANNDVGGDDVQATDENVNTKVAGHDVQNTDENVTSNVTGHDLETFVEHVNTNDAQKTDENANNDVAVDDVQATDENVNTKVASHDVQNTDGNVTSNVTCHNLETFDENVNTNDAQKTDENANNDVAGDDVQNTDENVTSNVTGHDLETTDDNATDITYADVQTTDVKVMSNITGNDLQTISDNATNIAGDGELTADDKIVTNITSNDVQTTDENIMTNLNREDAPSNDVQTTDANVMTIINGDDAQRIVDDLTTESDGQQAAKRRKLTRLEGELGLTGSLSNDLHL